MKIDNTLIPGLASAPAGQSPDAVGDSGEFELALDQATAAASPPDPGAITPTMNGEEANPIQPIAAGQTLDLLQSQTDLAPSQVVSPPVSTQKVEPLLNVTQLPTEGVETVQVQTDVIADPTEPVAPADKEAVSDSLVQDDVMTEEEMAAALAASLPIVKFAEPQVSAQSEESSPVGDVSGIEASTAPNQVSTSETLGSLMGETRSSTKQDVTEVVSTDKTAIRAEKVVVDTAPREPVPTVPTASKPEEQVTISGLTKNSSQLPKQELDPGMLSTLGLTEMTGETLDAPVQPNSDQPLQVLNDETAPLNAASTKVTPEAESVQPAIQLKSESEAEVVQQQVFTPQVAVTPDSEVKVEVSAEVPVSEPDAVQHTESREDSAKPVVAVTSAASPSTNQSFDSDADSKDELFQSNSIDAARPAEVGFQEPGVDNVKSTQAATVQKVAELPREAQQEVMQQTVDRIEKMAMHRPISVMTVRLMPEDLGAITVQIKTMGNKSEAEITATNERVVQALEVNRPQLVQAIEAKGATLSEMSLKHDASTNQQGQQGTKQEAERNQNFVSNVRTESAVVVERSWTPTGQEALNLVI